jgi:hypothetical protein
MFRRTFSMNTTTAGQRTRKQNRGGSSCRTYSQIELSSVSIGSFHPLRRGYVTEALNAGQPKEVTADRVDMTHEIMDKHYDKATKNEQMERREDYLKDV